MFMNPDRIDSNMGNINNIKANTGIISRLVAI